jgi:DnaA family protein
MKYEGNEESGIRYCAEFYRTRGLAAPESMRQLALAITAPAPPTLDNFIAGRNIELVERLRSLAGGGVPERFIYLWGAAGCGRSHLLKGALHAMCGAGLAAAHVSCAPGAGMPDDVERSDYVVLDDVDRLDPEAQIAAFHLYNRLRERQGMLVASGGAPPAQLPLREDLATRLAWGLVYHVAALTDEEKGRALDQRAEALGFRLPSEVRDFLLTRARRDIASLVAMVDALDRYSLETKRPVTVPLARELLARREDAGSAVRDPASGSTG